MQPSESSHPQSQHNVVELVMRSEVVPELAAVLRACLSPPNELIGEATRVAAPDVLVNELLPLLLRTPILDRTAGREPTALERGAARAVGTIIGKIFQEALERGHDVDRWTFGEFSQRLFGYLMSPQDCLIRVQNGIIDSAVRSADFEALFQQESEFVSVAAMLSQLSLYLMQGRANFVAYRTDIDDVVLHQKAGSGLEMFCAGGWCFKPEYSNIDDLRTAVSELSVLGEFKRTAPARYLGTEFADQPLTDESLAALADKQVHCFPLMHGSDYLGALYIISKANESDISVPARKDLQLACHAAARGLARVARIRAASSEFQSGDSE